MKATAIAAAGPSPGMNTVRIDNRSAARKLTTFLIRLGHRRIGFISGPSTHADSLERRVGYQDALRKAGIPVQIELTREGDFAGQGDGEVDITAIETSLVGTFQFIVRKDMHLKWPRKETPTHYMTMGFNDDLNACATLAVREMVDFLVTEKHLSRDDAYMLASVAADLHITELVDGNKGVHMMIPKAIFVSGAK
jgi:hypothetical protein